MLEEKNISMEADFYLNEVDNKRRVIVDYRGREIPFNCLVTISLHSGDTVLRDSGLTDEFGFVKADKYSCGESCFEITGRYENVNTSGNHSWHGSIHFLNDKKGNGKT